MSLAIVFAVGLVGGAGAIGRFLLDSAVAGRLRHAFPFGTLVVNVAGAFVLGAIVGATLDQNDYRVIGTGLIGAFTTFSTWALESHRLAEDGQLRLGAANVVVSLAAGLLAAWAGRQLGAWL